MKVLRTKLRREFTQASGRLMVIMSLVAIGGMSYVGMLSTYANLEETRREFYARCRMADVWFSVRKAPISILRSLEQTPGVAQLMPRIRQEVIVDLKQSQRPLAGRVLSMPRQRRDVINDIVIRSGGYFTGHRLNEVIVSHEFAVAHGLRPGDSIHLLLNNRRTELIVTGTAWSSEFAYLIGPGSILPDASNYGVFYIPDDYAEELQDMSGACNEIVCRLSPGADTEQIIATFNARLADYGVISSVRLEEQDSHFMLANEIKQGEQMAVTLASLFLIVAALILNLLLLRFIEQQRTTIGTLKALGCSNSQLSSHYITFGILTGLIGGILGCGLGQLLSFGMTQAYSEYFTFPELRTRMHGSLFFQGLLVSVVFSLTGALRGVWSVLHLQPAEAMRPQAPSRGVHVPLERWKWLWSRMSFALRMVSRELWRNRLRSGITLIVAMTGSAMMLTSLYYRDAFLYLVGFQYDLVDHSDLTLVIRDERDESALRDTRMLGNVNSVEAMTQSSGTLVHGHFRKKHAITGIESGSQLTTPRESDGTRIHIPSTGLAMDRRLAHKLNLEAGDIVSFIPTRLPERTIQFPVSRIVDNFLGLQVYADRRYLNRVLGEHGTVSSLQIAAPSRTQQRQILDAAREKSALQAISDTNQARQTLDGEIIENLNIVTTCLIVFSGAIFFGSVINTTLISLSERQRQIATLHVLGYQLPEVARIFLLESVVLNGIGAVLGLPLGWWLSKLSAEAFSSDLFRMPLVISTSTWVLTPLLGLVFCVLAHWVTIRVLNRLDWVSALMIRE